MDTAPKQCLVCSQALPTEDGFLFCPNCGGAILETKVLEGKTTLNYDPLSKYFKPWRDPCLLPKRKKKKRKQSLYDDSQHSSRSKPAWYPSMRQLRVPKPSATLIEQRLREKTEFWGNESSEEARNGVAGKRRVKIIFTSILDLIEEKDLPELPRNPANAHSTPSEKQQQQLFEQQKIAFEKSLRYDPPEIEKLRRARQAPAHFLVHEKVYPLAAYEAHWLAVQGAIVQIALVEQEQRQLQGPTADDTAADRDALLEQFQHRFLQGDNTSDDLGRGKGGSGIDSGISNGGGYAGRKQAENPREAALQLWGQAREGSVGLVSSIGTGAALGGGGGGGGMGGKDKRSAFGFVRKQFWLRVGVFIDDDEEEESEEGEEGFDCKDKQEWSVPPGLHLVESADRENDGGTSGLSSKLATAQTQHNQTTFRNCDQETIRKQETIDPECGRHRGDEPSSRNEPETLLNKTATGERRIRFAENEHGTVLAGSNSQEIASIQHQQRTSMTNGAGLQLGGEESVATESSMLSELVGEQISSRVHNNTIPATTARTTTAPPPQLSAATTKRMPAIFTHKIASAHAESHGDAVHAPPPSHMGLRVRIHDVGAGTAEVNGFRKAVREGATGTGAWNDAVSHDVVVVVNGTTPSPSAAGGGIGLSRQSSATERAVDTPMSALTTNTAESSETMWEQEEDERGEDDCPRRVVGSLEVTRATRDEEGNNETSGERAHEHGNYDDDDDDDDGGGNDVDEEDEENSLLLEDDELEPLPNLPTPTRSSSLRRQGSKRRQQRQRHRVEKNVSTAARGKQTDKRVLTHSTSYPSSGSSGGSGSSGSSGSSGGSAKGGQDGTGGRVGNGSNSKAIMRNTSACDTLGTVSPSSSASSGGTSVSDSTTSLTTATDSAAYYSRSFSQSRTPVHAHAFAQQNQPIESPLARSRTPVEGSGDMYQETSNVQGIVKANVDVCIGALQQEGKERGKDRRGATARGPQMEVVGYLSNDVARCLSFASARASQWVPISAVNAHEYYMSQHMQQVMLSIAHRVTFSPALTPAPAPAAGPGSAPAPGAGAGAAGGGSLPREGSGESTRAYIIRAHYERNGVAGGSAVRGGGGGLNHPSALLNSNIKNGGSASDSRSTSSSNSNSTSVGVHSAAWAAQDSAKVERLRRLVEEQRLDEQMALELQGKISKTDASKTPLPSQLTIAPDPTAGEGFSGLCGDMSEPGRGAAGSYRFRLNDTLAVINCKIKLEKCKSVKFWAAQVRMTVSYGKRIPCSVHKQSTQRQQQEQQQQQQRSSALTSSPMHTAESFDRSSRVSHVHLHITFGAADPSTELLPQQFTLSIEAAAFAMLAGKYETVLATLPSSTATATAVVATAMAAVGGKTATVADNGGGGGREISDRLEKRDSTAETATRTTTRTATTRATSARNAAASTIAGVENQRQVGVMEGDIAVVGEIGRMGERQQGEEGRKIQGMEKDEREGSDFKGDEGQGQGQSVGSKMQGSATEEELGRSSTEHAVGAEHPPESFFEPVSMMGSASHQPALSGRLSQGERAAAAAAVAGTGAAAAAAAREQVNKTVTEFVPCDIDAVLSEEPPVGGVFRSPAAAAHRPAAGSSNTSETSALASRRDAPGNAQQQQQQHSRNGTFVAAAAAAAVEAEEEAQFHAIQQARSRRLVRLLRRVTGLISLQYTSRGVQVSVVGVTPLIAAPASAAVETGIHQKRSPFEGEKEEGEEEEGGVLTTTRDMQGDGRSGVLEHQQQVRGFSYACVPVPWPAGGVGMGSPLRRRRRRRQRRGSAVGDTAEEEQEEGSDSDSESGSDGEG